MYWTNAAIDVLLFFFVIDCALMCLVVMMQRSKQEGLGAAFGGGFTESVWGAQTSQVLVKATVWLAALFFLFSIGLARLYSQRASLEKELSPIQQQLLHPAAAAKTTSATSPSAPATTNVLPAATPVVPTATPLQPSANATPVAPAAPAAPSK
jgi:preprotein translocase subunit SecG